MIRISLLAVGMTTLAQIVPGCPLTDSTTDNTTHRGNITTAASTSATNADVGETVTLSATAQGGGVSFSWFQIAGSGVRLSDASSASATFVAPSLSAAQTLKFRVSTRNADGDVGYADVEVAISADPNFGQSDDDDDGGGGGGGTAVVARAGSDQTVDQSTTVSLDGRASSGTGLTFRWKQLSGPTVLLANADTSVASFNAPFFSPGTADNRLVFELLVRDASGRSSTDTVTITIRNPAFGGKSRVRMKTSMGDIVVELEDDKSPLTVTNFLQYVDDQFYDDTLIHRVIPDFVIQGGGFTANGNEKTTRAAIINEAKTSGLLNTRGTIAMARTNDANSATSQFFINLKDNTTLDPTDSNPGYAVFGTVVEGMSIVDEIAGVETTTKNFNGSPYDDVPVEDVVVNSIRRE
ncbi:MAG: hypothetical protein CHACPFDD_03266 [Phycisphaerae bacterium]|nr:hypothetical protein [Phycisphaerae bacterium]